MTRILRRTAPILALVLLPAPALAEGEWGALALSERSTVYGYAYDFATPETASARALAECGRNAGDCRVHAAFRNTCLVLAGSVDGPFGWAWGGAKATRAERALEQCRQHGAVNCKVVETVCSGTVGGPPAPRNPARALEPPAGPAATTPRTTSTPPAPDTRTPGAPLELHRQ